MLLFSYIRCTGLHYTLNEATKLELQNVLLITWFHRIQACTHILMQDDFWVHM